MKRKETQGENAKEVASFRFHFIVLAHSSRHRHSPQVVLNCIATDCHDKHTCLVKLFEKQKRLPLGHDDLDVLWHSNET